MLDAYGNIARADEPYAILQDVASACRLFIAELWYDEAKGIQYFQTIFGRFQPIQTLKAQLVTAALTVPGVITAQAFISGLTDRTVSGQVQVTLADGTTHIVAL